jgi:hypothetical protein
MESPTRQPYKAASSKSPGSKGRIRHYGSTLGNIEEAPFIEQSVWITAHTRIKKAKRSTDQLDMGPVRRGWLCHIPLEED